MPGELRVLFRTDEDYKPFSVPQTNTNNRVVLKYKQEKTIGLAVPGYNLHYVGGEQFLIQSCRSSIMVAPTIGFVRTGKMDTPVNINLTAWQYGTNGWFTMESWVVQIPSNVSRYSARVATCNMFNGFWGYIEMNLEHALYEEGISIDQYATFVEVAAYYG